MGRELKTAIISGLVLMSAEFILRKISEYMDSRIVDTMREVAREEILAFEEAKIKYREEQKKQMMNQYMDLYNQYQSQAQAQVEEPELPQKKSKKKKA